MICEEGKLPDWATFRDGKGKAVDIRDLDKDPVKKVSFSKCYQPTCLEVQKDDSKDIAYAAARTKPLPRVVMLGMVPEDLTSNDLVAEETIEPKEGK